MSVGPVSYAGVATKRRRVPRDLRLIVGGAMLATVVVLALAGPLLAPHPLAAPIGAPGSPPGHGAPLGTDALGRDVLSRVLHGGSSLLLLSAVSVALTYVLAITIGMAAGFSRARWGDAVLMRTVDLFLVYPPLLLLLLLTAGAGPGNVVIVVGIVLVTFPGAARLVRTAALEVSTAGYIEAAIARGEKPTAIMRREILPNVAPSLIADAGVRFLASVFLVASLNFLGVGSQPPAANWALMISENRAIIPTNPWGVLVPSMLIACLTLSVNLLGDAYAASLDRSEERT